MNGGRRSRRASVPSGCSGSGSAPRDRCRGSKKTISASLTRSSPALNQSRRPAHRSPFGIRLKLNPSLKNSVSAGRTPFVSTAAIGRRLLTMSSIMSNSSGSQLMRLRSWRDGLQRYWTCLPSAAPVESFPSNRYQSTPEAERRTLLVPVGPANATGHTCRSLPRQPHIGAATRVPPRGCVVPADQPCMLSSGSMAGACLTHSLLHMRTSQAQQCYLIGSSCQVPSPSNAGKEAEMGKDTT